MLKELKETMLKEVRDYIKTMPYQTKSITKVVEII